MGSTYIAEGTTRSPNEALEPGLEHGPPICSRPRGESRPSPRAGSARFGAAGSRDYGAAMASEAAIFDLDRTLLTGASGPAISAALRQVKLLTERTIPGEDLLFRVFNLVGENRPSMMLTRQGARLARGWARDRAREAGELAARALLPMVQPYARVLIDEHHAAGRLVVVATTTPVDMVEPFAKALGLDAVIATRYDTAEGEYTGAIDGEFVWGKGKLRAVQEWTEANDIELRSSWAYSDSWFDIPLLSAVGHPIAVNPDPRLRAFALLRRWPVQFLDVPPGVPKFLGIEPQQAIFPFARAELVPYARLRDRRRRAHPGRWAGDHLRQSPQLLRPVGDRVRRGQAGPTGSIPRQERSVRRADRR